MCQLSVDTRNGGGDVVVSVRGEVDISTVAELERALDDALEGPAERVVLDLRRLDFMDGSGAAALWRQELHARAIARPLIVVRGPRAIQRLFEVTQLTDKLTIVDAVRLTVV